MAEAALNIFISYSHNDFEMLTELIKHLTGLRRTNKITIWDDRDIEAGGEWEPAIQEQLNTADIIILLISADFIASDYCYGNELQRAIARHDAREARVIPVILKPCLWDDSDIPFSKLNVLPDRARAITQWEDAAEAYTNIAEGISSAVASLRNRKLKKLKTSDLASVDWNTQPSVSISSNEVLIEQVREHSRQKILERHSRMRLLSGNEIGVDQLYVDVWLLGKPERKHFNTSESLLSSFDIEQDRLALSKRIQRNPGFDIANRNPKLVILGKPGSGKTTFLKHLAVDWCKKKFQAEKIAVLIELRRIQEQIQNQVQNQQWSLVDVIGQELELGRKTISDLLESGKLLVLLDGLDEVPTNELRREVEVGVEQVSKKYSNKNRFILTCRTQVMGAIPSSFASVEVADFSPNQVKQFVQNWFTANGQPEIKATQKWDLMRAAISNQPDLREVTATPVLLSLICIVWQDSGEIPTNRTNLYKRGSSWLLKRWNDEKKIEGWEVGTEAYRKLSIKDKETLLTEIAARKFENPKNFVLFEQDELVEQITKKLQLANAQEGLAVLKAIEAQHGLLIERADELWSFSHLTFQEFFTVQWLTQLTSQQLAEKIANQQWRKAVEQLVKSQQPADRLLRLIKQAMDQLIAQEPAIQNILTWLLHKSSSLQSNYKPVAIRSFYYSLILALARNSDSDRALDRALDLGLALARVRASAALDCTRDHDLGLDRARDHDLASASASVLDLALDLDHDLALDLGLDHDLDLNLALALDFAVELDVDLGSSFDSSFDLDSALNRAIDSALAPELLSRLRKLKTELPTSTHSQEIQRWWSLHRAQWSEKLRQVMIEYRNIGHDWQFTEGKKKQLQRYYETNHFLIDLMKIEGAVSEECRIELEEGLLLPWAELQHRQPHLYGDLME